MNRFLFLVLAFAGAAAGCFVVPAVDEQADNANTEGKQDKGGVAAASRCTDRLLPAGVQAMLAARCLGCHSEGGNTPMALSTYDDLLAPAASDASRSVAAVVLERIQAANAPMPPSQDGVTVPQDEIDVFRAWLDAGTPKSTSSACASEGEPAPGVAITTVCTSGVTWDPKGGNVTLQNNRGDDDDDDDRNGPRMNPGKACINCHNSKEGKPLLQLGGTVYPTVREPDLCWGAGTDGAKVVVIDAHGVEWPMQLTDTGNFSWSTDDEQIAFPITAKVVSKGGRERVMNTPQNSGDCNSCHSEHGANGAPGRIFLP